MRSITINVSFINWKFLSLVFYGSCFIFQFIIESTTERPPKGIHIISSEKLTPPSTHSRDEQFSRLPSKIICSTGGTIPNENYSYVQLNTAHDYNYPVMDEPPIMSSAALSAASRRDSLSSLKKRANDTPPESLKDSRPIKAQPQRLRCR